MMHNRHLKIILKIVSFVLIFVLLLALIVIAIPDQFGKSYQRALVRQYDYFKNLQGNKIVLIGGSSLSFGIDLDVMESLTGEQAAILGNHASYGLPFLLAMSKKNLIPGDKVILEFVNTPVDRTEAAALLLTGIGKRFDMYQFFVPEIRHSVVEEYPAYVRDNIKYWRTGKPYDPEIPYYLEAYDERGNMTLNRPDPWLTEDYITKKNPDDLHFQDYYTMIRNLNYDLFAYLNDYISWCEEKSVSVFLTVAPVYDDSVPEYCGDDVLDEYDSILMENIHCPMISRSKDYVLPREYFFDSNLHCNTAGARLRTEMLCSDLKNYFDSLSAA